MIERHEVARIEASVKGGARRALIRMTGEWQFCGKATFNANGAWALYHQRGVRRGALAERELRPDGKWKRDAYRLTPLGIIVRDRARDMDEARP